jgi:hypothetical protein
MLTFKAMAESRIHSEDDENADFLSLGTGELEALGICILTNFS